jgi:YggT family protein
MFFLPPINLFFILCDLLEILALLIIVAIILSWAMYFGARGISPYHPLVRKLRKITNPVLEPFRRLVPPYKLQGFDISPILAILVIQILQRILFRLGTSMP